MIQITVPATSANLGSGFDSMGVALTLYNRISMEESDRVDITVLGGCPVRTDATNLIYRTVEKLYAICGRQLHGLRLIEEAAIPKTRGLGSSSACIVAAALGANRMLGEPLDRAALIDFAAREEGHPDNSTPALTGGMVAAVFVNGHVQYAKIPMARRLRFAALIPDFSLKTERARAALPETVSHADACYNIARAALLAASAASGNLENLRVAMEDRIHQPYRFAMIPGGAELVKKLLAAGAAGACISGAGPTLLAIADAEEKGFQKAIERILQDEYPAWRVQFLSCDETGARVREN